VGYAFYTDAMSVCLFAHCPSEEKGMVTMLSAHEARPMSAILLECGCDAAGTNLLWRNLPSPTKLGRPVYYNSCPNLKASACTHTLPTTHIFILAFF
jgi:hypothetical protein